MLRTKLFLVVLGGALFSGGFCACSNEETAALTETASLVAALATGVSNEDVIAKLPHNVDMQAVMNRAHFAFRADGKVLRGGHDQYGV